MQSDCASKRENRAKALEKERVRRYHVDIENENLPEGTLHMKFGIEGGSPDSISQYRPINTDNSLLHHALRTGKFTGSGEFFRAAA